MGRICGGSFIALAAAFCASCTFGINTDGLAGSDAGVGQLDARLDARTVHKPDARSGDAGHRESGEADAGSDRRGVADTGSRDTSVPVDAGGPEAESLDTGTPDTGKVDTGKPDTGVDAGGGCTFATVQAVPGAPPGGHIMKVGDTESQVIGEHAGDLLVAIAYGGQGPSGGDPPTTTPNQTFTVSDSLGNTYYAGEMIENSRSSEAAIQIFYAPNVKGGMNTVTAVQTVPGGLMVQTGLFLQEYSGIATTDVVDVSSGQMAPSMTATVVPGPMTTFTGCELVVGAFTDGHVSEDDSLATGAGWVMRSADDWDPADAVDNIGFGGPAGSANATMLLTGEADDGWVAVQMAFRPSTSAAPPQPTGIGFTTTAQTVAVGACSSVVTVGLVKVMTPTSAGDGSPRSPLRDEPHLLRRPGLRVRRQRRQCWRRQDDGELLLQGIGERHRHHRGVIVARQPDPASDGELSDGNRNTARHRTLRALRQDRVGRHGDRAHRAPRRAGRLRAHGRDQAAPPAVRAATPSSSRCSSTRRASPRASATPTSSRRSTSWRRRGELFLVMEYVQGESLAPRARRRQRAASGSPCAIAAAHRLGDALHGLHAAHEATDERGEPLGIVHRDVSPQNILVGVDGIARVLDFGVAKAAGRAADDARRPAQGQARVHGARAAGGARHRLPGGHLLDGGSSVRGPHGAAHVPRCRGCRFGSEDPPQRGRGPGLGRSVARCLGRRRAPRNCQGSNPPLPDRSGDGARRRARGRRRFERGGRRLRRASGGRDDRRSARAASRRSRAAAGSRAPSDKQRS